MQAPAIKVRRSIYELQTEYEKGNQQPLHNLMKAWKGIKDLHYTDKKSFFYLGGLHGEPFRGAGWGFGNNTWWGGYCNHGNVLFPTWHRVYCLKLEQALQSICPDVMLPYWDETSSESLAAGIPWALTRAEIEFDGVMTPNPLLSFTLPIPITDNVSTDNGLYTKPAGYETVRFPLSGLVNAPETAPYNAQYTDYDKNVTALNNNVIGWLNDTVLLPPVPAVPGTPVTPAVPAVPASPPAMGVYSEYKKCLQAPNYTVFSNVTSAQQWNSFIPAGDAAELVVPLEQPHNDIHLAVGGFDVPGQGDFSPSPYVDANGDMGENDTAALDPIFYFHHCNVDRVFWIWQKLNGSTDSLDIIEHYPGTNSSDNQGATPGIAPNLWLDLDTPLNPFKRDDNGSTYTSRDCINIETQLGYTYSLGSLDTISDRPLISTSDASPAASGSPVAEAATTASAGTKILHVSKINKAPFKGSFVVAAYLKVAGKKHLIGYKSVLNRWDSGFCANCQTHLEVKAFFPIHPSLLEKAANVNVQLEDNFTVEIISRRQSATQAAAFTSKKPYKLEVR